MPRIRLTMEQIAQRNLARENFDKACRAYLYGQILFNQGLLTPTEWRRLQKRVIRFFSLSEIEVRSLTADRA